MKMKRNVILALLLVVLLVLSLGACSGGKGGGLDDGAAGGGNDSADSGGAGDGIDDTGPAFKSSGGGQDSLDSSVFLPDGYIYYFPEYKDSIEWYTIPADYIGSLSSYVTPSKESTGVVNIRSGPSKKAEVIGKITRKDEVYWWCKPEFYVGDDEEFYLGMYKVKADDYTWTYVSYSSEDSSLTGWVALEVVEVIWL